jgi:glycerol uptake facilitator-like aquaporin
MTFVPPATRPPRIRRTAVPRRVPLPPVLRTAVAEFALTCAMLFIVETLARWTFDPGSPLAALLPGLRAKLVVMGLVVGCIVTAVLGPSMRHGTAGHLNPAVSIGLWLLRVFPGTAVLPFVAAQLAGSAAGVVLARGVWGAAVADPVGYAVLGPAPGWSAGAVFAVEAAALGGIMLIVAAAVARPRLARFLPPVVGGCVAAVIIFLGPVEGGGANPARQFGPALLAGRTDLLWAYLFGPVAGALAAAGLAHALRPAAPVPSVLPREG